MVHPERGEPRAWVAGGERSPEPPGPCRPGPGETRTAQQGKARGVPGSGLRLRGSAAVVIEVPDAAVTAAESGDAGVAAQDIRGECLSGRVASQAPEGDDAVRRCPVRR